MQARAEQELQRKVEVAAKFWELKRMHSCFSAWQRMAVVAQEARALHAVQQSTGASYPTQQQQQQQVQMAQQMTLGTLQQSNKMQDMVGQKQSRGQDWEQQQQQQQGVLQDEPRPTSKKGVEQDPKVAAFLKAIAAKQEAMYAGGGEGNQAAGGGEGNQGDAIKLQRPVFQKPQKQQQQQGKQLQRQHKQQQQQACLASAQSIASSTSSSGSSSSSSLPSSGNTVQPRPSISSKLSSLKTRRTGKLFTPVGSVSVLDPQQQQQVLLQQRRQRQQQQQPRRESELLEAKLLAEASAELEGALGQDDPDALLASLTSITEHLSWTQQLWGEQGNEQQQQQSQEVQQQQYEQKEQGVVQCKEQQERQQDAAGVMQAPRRQQQHQEGEEEGMIDQGQQRQEGPVHTEKGAKFEGTEPCALLFEQQEEQQDKDRHTVVAPQANRLMAMANDDEPSLPQQQLVGESLSQQVLRIEPPSGGAEPLQVQQQQRGQQQAQLTKQQRMEQQQQQRAGQQQQVRHLSLQRLKRERQQQELLSALQQEIQQQAAALADMHYQRGLVVRCGLRPWGWLLGYRREQMEVAARWWGLQQMKKGVEGLKEALWHR